MSRLLGHGVGSLHTADGQEALDTQQVLIKHTAVSIPAHLQRLARVPGRGPYIPPKLGLRVVPESLKITGLKTILVWERKATG